MRLFGTRTADAITRGPSSASKALEQRGVAGVAGVDMVYVCVCVYVYEYGCDIG
jgi:hypothetical protein